MPVVSGSVQEDHIEEEETNGEEADMKESCHDSGIDIRETPLVPVAPIPVKEVCALRYTILYLRIVGNCIQLLQKDK